MKGNVIAIIPARAGSKGVKNKNKKIVCGKPLIAYTIEVALKSKSLDYIVVTTDDKEIAEIARELGVLVIDRPSVLAQDESPVFGAVRHAVEYLANEKNITADVVVLLQPTSPLRTAQDIDNCVELRQLKEKTICSVCACEDNHPARMYTISDFGLEALFSSFADMRRQDLPKIYHRNGAVYAFSYSDMLSKGIISDEMVPYIMGPDSSINIDTEMDLVLLEWALSNK